MILKNIKQGKIQEVSLEHLRFKVVSDNLSVNLINLHAIDGLIIKTNELKTVRQILNQVRIKNDPSIYLMPIYLDSKTLYQKLGSEVDGYTIDNLNALNGASVNSIQQRIQGIKNDLLTIPDYNHRMIVKALQYAFTREQNLLPYTDRNSPIGYHLPYISTVLSSQEVVKAFNQLKKLVDRNLLTSKLEDKVNLCHTCQGSYLNFYESCSKCASMDLEHENLIHHFRCAYIGPESDFKNEDQMICPKCDKQLKHIGIDYDKPSEVATCRQCTHTSQETKMKASCIDCGSSNSLSQLKTLEIPSYQLTSEGVDYILSAKFSKGKEKDAIKDLSVVPYSIFNLLVEQEKARAANRKGTSSFAGELNINPSIYEDLAKDFRSQLKSEILNILRTYLRPIDILCANHTGKYSFIMPDCTKAKAYELYLLLLDNLNKLLSDNISNQTQIVSGDLRKL